MRLWTILIVSLSVVIGTGPGLAQDRLVSLSSEIKREAEQRAMAFRQNPAAPAPQLDGADTLLISLDEFALLTHRLSAQIEAEGGPSDLKCIFRGMSGDVSARIEQLNNAETRADLARAYNEIAYLANQAESIANDPDARAAGNSLPPSCPSKA